jgi:hypothetical protein
MASDYYLIRALKASFQQWIRLGTRTMRVQAASSTLSNSLQSSKKSDHITAILPRAHEEYSPYLIQQPSGCDSGFTLYYHTKRPRFHW